MFASNIHKIKVTFIKYRCKYQIKKTGSKPVWPRCVVHIYSSFEYSQIFIGLLELHNFYDAYKFGDQK